jgi:cytochrome P450/NADPH-cytochrome P450 reductase
MADASTTPKTKPDMYSSALTAQPLPAPPALPWVGHLLSIPKSQLTQYLLETSKGFDGVLALDFAGVKVPFVFDPDLVAELSDPQRFEKTVGPPLSTLRRVAGDGLFTARGDEPNWGKAHRILQPAFGQRAMKGYFPLMLEVASQLSATWTRGGPTRAGATAQCGCGTARPCRPAPPSPPILSERRKPLASTSRAIS